MAGGQDRAAEALVGQGQRDHYATAENLEKRQALFSYRDRSRSVGEPPFDRVEWTEGTRVLDAGCGNGNWTRILRARVPATEIVGLDLSMGMLTESAALGPERALLNADVQALPVAGGSLDVVLALWMLYHVPDPQQALLEFRRVLRPGGCLLAATNSNLARRTDEVLGTALAAVTGRRDVQWLPSLGFSAENGEKTLHAVFDRVECHPVVGALAVPDPAPVLAAMLSVSEAVETVLGEPVDWGAVEAEARREIERAIARDGSFRTEIHSAWFLAWA